MSKSRVYNLWIYQTIQSIGDIEREGKYVSGYVHHYVIIYSLVDSKQN